MLHTLSFCGLLLAVAVPVADAQSVAEPPPHRWHVDVGWPSGITYEFGARQRWLEEAGTLSAFEHLRLAGRIGVRLDLDAAAFDADRSLGDDYDDGVAVRRARFYLLGDLRFGIPVGYKFEFSIERSRVFLNDFYLRFTPARWVDTVDVGYLTPPMGLENVISSRSLTFMEIAAPIQALAPGFRSGVAAAGHSEPWRLAWEGGIYSAGQKQISGDASSTSAQLVGRLAWVPWREAAGVGPALVHLGLSAGYVVSGENRIRYRARPESFIAPFAVDTGDIDAESAVQVGLEAAWADGPLLLQAEGIQSSVASVDGADHSFQGAYGLVAWMLTGEDHPYDATTGMFTRVLPRAPVTFAPGTGWGAWEIGQRVSWLDLSDGDVRGGTMLTVTSGVTWHLNAQLRLAANYVFAHVANHPEKGDVSIFQMRVEIGI